MKLSIITISFKDLEGLKKTVESVLSQSDTDFEYIVIDGGSGEETKKFLESKSDKISYWISEPDGGIYNAMNKGITIANGEYLLFLNSGDILYNKNVTADAKKLLDGTDLISGNLNMDDGKAQYIEPSRTNLTFKTLFRYSIDHPATFIRRENFKKVGLYDESLKIVADWKWFLLGFAKFGLSYKNIDLTVATFDMNGLSSKPDNRAKLIAERKKVLQEEFPFFIEDYNNLIDYEEDAKNFRKIKNSGWIKLGRKIGLMKNVRF